MFSRFGPILDITIKKSNQYLMPFEGLHSGYGFVLFPETQEGINCALTLTRNVQNTVINDVVYDCRISHSLERLMNQLHSMHHSDVIPPIARDEHLHYVIIPMKPQQHMEPAAFGIVGESYAYPVGSTVQWVSRPVFAPPTLGLAVSYSTQYPLRGYQSSAGSPQLAMSPPQLPLQQQQQPLFGYPAYV